MSAARWTRPTTDGVVTLRTPEADDAAALVAGRDDVSRRFLGEGDPEPRPTACIEVGGEVVGWVDHDERDWLAPDECNLGYQVFAPHRGRGHASRAVQLLLHRLALEGRYSAATLLIDRANERSLALAERLGFPRAPDLDGHPFFTRPVPPLRYTDGQVTIRRQDPDDLEMDVAAKDAEQIRWLWLPGQAEHWASMSVEQQRAHALQGLEANQEAFGRGPKWSFAVDAPDRRAVAYVDVDLANEHVPAGEANVSYAAHPEHRRQGAASRAVVLATRFLRDHTAAREAHLIAEVENHASLGVARAVGAAERERWTDSNGHTLVRHVLPIER